MENTTTLLDLIRDSYQKAIELVHQWEETAIAFKEDFFTRDFRQLKEEDYAGSIYYLASVYKATAFFGDEQVKKKFVEVGLTAMNHTWFMDLEAILIRLNLINKSGEALLRPYETLLLIKLHLDTKINLEIMQWEGLTRPFNDKKYTTKIKADLYNLYRRRDPHTSALKRPKGAYDLLLNELLQDAEKRIGDPAHARNTLLQLSDGNTKKSALKAIVESSLIFSKTDQFYSTFFPLFSLIDPFKGWMSEEEFYEQSLYDSKTYKGYQAKRVRDLIK